MRDAHGVSRFRNHPLSDSSKQTGHRFSGFRLALSQDGALRWILSAMLAQPYANVTGGALRRKFADLLGATNAHIGWMQAIPNFIQAAQMFAPLLIERLQRRKPLVLRCTALSYCLWLVIAVIPWCVPPPLRPWAMIALIALSVVFMAIQTPARQSWLADIIPHGLRGRFLGSLSMMTTLITLSVVPLAGMLTDKLPQRWGLSCIFVVVVGVALMAVWNLSHVPEPPKKQTNPERILPFLGLPFQHPDFRFLILFFACRSAAVVMGATYFDWYLIKEMKLPMVTITLFNSTYQQGLMFLTYPVWGRLIDRFGSHRMLAIAAFGNALFPLPWVLMTKDNVIPLLLFGYWLTGLSNPGLTVAQQNYMMHIAPKEHRSVYFGAFAAIVSVSNACGALLSKSIVTWLEGTKHVLWGLPLDHFKMVFLISLIARLSCMFLLIPLRHAERRASQ